MTKKSETLCIDLGTSNTAAARPLENGDVAIVNNPDVDRGEPDNWWQQDGNHKHFASDWHFNEAGELTATGNHYREGEGERPAWVVTAVKPLLGKNYLDAKAEGLLDRYPRVKPHRRNGRCVIEVGGRAWLPEDLLCRLYGRVKECAESQFGMTFDSAIITSPANWNQAQVSLLIDAARRAGFREVRNISEPVAAAHAMRLEIGNRICRAHVIDIGAGTLDVSAGHLYRNENNDLEFQPTVNIGHNGLGGSDFLERLTGLVRRLACIGQMDNAGLAELRHACERAMMALADNQEAEVVIPGQDPLATVRVDQAAFKAALQGEDGERDLLEEFRQHAFAAVGEAGWEAEEVDALILIGGPSRMPVLLDCLRIMYTRNPGILSQVEAMASPEFRFDRMNAVALGAAMSLRHRVQDIVPAGYGVEDVEINPGTVVYKPRILVPRNSRPPFQGEEYRVPWMMPSGLYDIKIIMHVPENEQSGHAYRFVHVIKFATSTPDMCEVVVTMKLTENKELRINVANRLTGESASFIGLPNANVGVTYPMEVTRLPGIQEQNLVRVDPTAEILDRFLKWLAPVLVILKQKIEAAPGTQMELAQLASEISYLVKKERMETDYQRLYTKMRALINNCTARGIVSADEGNRMMAMLTSYEDGLFQVKMAATEEGW